MRTLRQGRSRARLLVLLAAAVLVAAVLGGCAEFESAPTGSQADIIGDVHVQTVICLDGFGPNSGAENSGDGNPTPCDDATEGVGSSSGQLLIGYEVPSGSTAPETITSPDLPGVTFSQDPDYSSYLNSSSSGSSTPGPLPNTTWYGYISSEIDGITAAQLVHVDAPFTLPAGTGSAPYQGPFATEEALGDRVVNSSLAADRPLDCSEGDGTSTTATPSETTDCEEDSNEVSVDTRDLSVSAPAPVQAVAGSTAILPFAIQYAGTADSTATFSLTATSDAPGVTATSADQSLAPADNSTTTENVTVPLPANLTPGTYHVKLTATGGTACTDQTKCTRSDTATITVTAPQVPTTTTTTTTAAPVPVRPISKPKARKLTQRLVQVAHPSISRLFSHGEQVRVSCNQACAVRVELFVYHRAIGRSTKYRSSYSRIVHAAAARLVKPSTKVVIAREIVNLPRKGQRTVTVQLGSMARYRLSFAGSILLGARTSATAAAGQRSTATDKKVFQVPGPDILARLRAALRRHATRS